MAWKRQIASNLLTLAGAGACEVEGGGLFTERPRARWDLADIFVGGGQRLLAAPRALSGAWDPLQVAGNGHAGCWLCSPEKGVWQN